MVSALKFLFFTYPFSSSESSGWEISVALCIRKFITPWSKTFCLTFTHLFSLGAFKKSIDFFLFLEFK